MRPWACQLAETRCGAALGASFLVALALRAWEKRTQMVPEYSWDPKAPGLALRTRASGKTSWVYRYKTAAGKVRQIVLGPGTMARKDARKLATLRAAEVVRRDPIRELRAVTVEHLVAYYREHHRTQKKGRRPDEDRNVRRHLDMIKAAWGSRRADQITHEDVAALQAELAGLYSRNRLRDLVRGLWRCGVRWRFIAPTVPNPADGAPRNRERPRDVSAPTPDEMHRIYQAAIEYATSVSMSSGCAIATLVLTGARPTEVLHLRREDVVAGESITFRDRKAGDTMVVESIAAASVVGLCLSTHTSAWAFPGRRGGGSPLRDIKNPWKKVRAMAGVRSGLRIYDLRAGVATAVAAAAGSAVAQRVLGHADPRTTARYTRPGDAERRAGLEAHVAGLARGK